MNLKIYPRNSTGKEKRLMNMMVVSAFLVFLITATAFVTNKITVEFLTWIVAILFLVIMSMEVIVLKILLRNKQIG